MIVTRLRPGSEDENSYTGATSQPGQAEYVGQLNPVSDMGPEGAWDGLEDEAFPRSPYDEERLGAMGPVAMDGLESPMLQYEGDQDRMFRAVQRSYRSLEGYREMNRKLVEDYGGTYYQNNAVGEEPANRYVNLLNQAVEAYQMLLAANLPRVMVSTNLKEYRAFGKHFEFAVNSLIKEIGLEHTMSQWVMDAFFCMGVVKTHMADAGMVQLETDLWMDPGKPFASNIALDDFVYDMKAAKWSEVRFAGDMYSLSWEDATEIFGEEAMEEHTPRSRTSDDVDRVETISRSNESDSDDFEEMIDLADIWVPRHGKIYTYVVHSRRDFTMAGKRPVAVEDWTGDEHGPYHLLCFGEVPQNIMPASPASHLEMLDALTNDLFRKSARQARRQKDVHTYTPAGAASAQQIQLADDGEWVAVQDTSDVGMMKQGGVDQGNYAFLVGSMETFDRMAGNLTSQLGLGSQADTLGQEQLISSASGKKVDKMSKVVVGAVTRLIRALGLMLWQDEFKQIVMQMPVPGTEYSATSVWKPGDREGDFLDYDFTIDVYSMQYQSPQSKLAQLNQVVQGVFLPMAEMLMQQGGTIDMFALAERYADLLNLPELKDIVRFMGIPDQMQPQSASMDGPRKSPTSTRNYVRHNVSSDSKNPMQASMSMMGQAGQQQGAQTPGGMT